MARIELKNTNIILKDGLSGTGLVNEVAPGATDTTVGIDNVSVNTANPTKVPVGARFTVSTAGNSTKYTVTARTLSAGVDEVQSLTGATATTGTVTIAFSIKNPSSPGAAATAVNVTGIAFDATAAAIQTAVDLAMAAAGITNYVAGDITVGGGDLNTAAVTFTYDGTSVSNANHGEIVATGTGGYDGTLTEATTTEGQFVDQVTDITFSPAWGTPTPADNDTITFLPQEVTVKIGDGNITFTENKEYEYELDRGLLDTVRETEEVPMDVTIDLVYENITTGTGEDITVVDALKKINGASEFVSASSDPCEPYAIDIVVEHEPPCVAVLVEAERVTFPDFRHDSLEYDYDEATISATGRCKATDALVERYTP